jgi:hypothetical protein
VESDRLPRKLIANVYADVAGYSRLTGEDERSSARAKFWTPIKFSEVLDTHKIQRADTVGVRGRF